MKQKGLAPILIVLILAVLVGGYLVYTNYSNNRTKVTPPQPTTTPTSNTESTPIKSESTGSAETANWKTYSNSYYQIRYPDNLYKVEQHSSASLNSTSFNSYSYTGKEDALQNVLPIGITVSNLNEKMSLDNPKSLFGITGNTSYIPEFLKDKTPILYMVDNVKGYVIYDIGAGPSGLEREVIVVKGDKIFDIQTDVSYGKDQNVYKKLVDQILSTFKFTN